MGIEASRRMAAGRFCVAAVACAGALAFAGQAAAATTTFPAGGSAFEADANGWAGSDATCGPLNPLTLFCSTSNVHDPAVGDPGGSIATRVDVTLNVSGLWTGSGTWSSPAFTPQPAGPVTGASFSYERRLDSAGIADMEPASAVTVTLVDDTAGGSTIPILTDNLTSAVAFAPREVAVPAGAIVAGHSYRLRIATTMSSSVVGAVGSANTRFDDVRLAVSDGSATGGQGSGGATANVSAGVQVTGRSVTDSQIAQLIARYGIHAERGNGVGGSLIPRARCTIVGTSGRDRIVGTRANEVICGRGGNDVIRGGGGRDAIDGGNGADRLGGGGARDLLLGLRGNDRGNGGAGNDAIGGGAGRDILSGGTGRDRLNGRSGRDRIAGNGAADRLLARDRTRDVVLGGRGRDRASVDSARGSRRSARRADRVRGVERLR